MSVRFSNHDLDSNFQPNGKYYGTCSTPFCQTVNTLINRAFRSSNDMYTMLKWSFFILLWSRSCFYCIQSLFGFTFLVEPPTRMHNNKEQSHHNRQHRIQCRIIPLISASTLIFSKQAKIIDDEEEGSDKATDWESISAELLFEDEDDGLNDGEWLSDREKARIKLEQQERTFTSLIQDGKFGVDHLGQEVSSVESTSSATKTTPTPKTEDTASVHSNDAATSLLDRPSPYTEEEEEIINAMGGKTRKVQRRREPGFLGDSTLSEICTDYSVPISYLADVLCMWDVPVPINIHDTLGDLVTGEQAFALVEAVNTLDVSALHDRHSNINIQQLCYEWDIDLQQAFEMCMKEGWSLPFGVQTCLRIEQERELLRVLGIESGLVDVQDDDYDYDSY